MVLWVAGRHLTCSNQDSRSGTSPSSGIALLSSALGSLATRGSKVVCTTHFLEMFSMGLLRDGENGIRALRMAIRVPETTEEEAVPLFKLELGVANSSAGLICAKMAGVKQGVIDRAHEIVEATRTGVRVQPLIEIWRSHLSLSPAARKVCHQFLEADWNRPSDEDVNQLLSLVQYA